jgi:hypothetical protein
VLDIDPGGNRTGHDLSARALFIEAGKPLPHPVNLFHMNPLGMQSLFRDLAGLVDIRTKRNVCVPYWELPRSPRSWKLVLDTMDAVMAPSHFIRMVIAEAGVASPCAYYRQTLALPQAFPDRRALLLIKINNPDLSEDARRVVERFKAVAADSGDIRVTDRSMPYGEVASLFASIDVYVSLHRSEGLGLGMMECMALGKPVIATDWSGNADFLDETNACPIPYSLVPFDPGTQDFAVSEGVEQVWAEPSVEAAAQWMERLDASPGLRAEIGAKAKTSVTSYLDEAWRGGAFTEVETICKDRSGNA